MTNAEIKDTLIAARAKIASPDLWLKGLNAKDVEGTPVEPDDPLACKFCIIGAIRSAEAATDKKTFHKAYKHLKHYLPSKCDNFGSIFNDAPETTHADVLSLFDRAIGALNDPTTSNLNTASYGFPFVPTFT